MMPFRMLVWFIAVAAAVQITACTATKFTSIWRDEAYEGNPVKIMVIGVSRTPARGRLFEDEFVKELEEQGIGAVAGYTVLPDHPVVDIGAIRGKVTGVGADAVLVTKPIGSRTATTGGPWGTYEDEYLDIQTNVYDVKSGKMVWTATSETLITHYASNEAQIRSFVKTIVKRLLKQDVLRPVQSRAGDK